jgi:hypothetical protein
MGNECMHCIRQKLLTPIRIGSVVAVAVAVAVDVEGQASQLLLTARVIPNIYHTRI